jgi:putative ABC transport system permease protein
VKLAETARIALGGIAANKLRSGLTILGLTIGVASVIVLVAVGNGSERQVEAGIDVLGSNVLLVSTQAGPMGPGGSGGSSLTLTQPTRPRCRTASTRRTSGRPRRSSALLPRR